VHRRAIIATPDLWFRVNWRTLRVELEAAGNFGRFYLRDVEGTFSDARDDPENFYDVATLSQHVLASFGYALEFKYGFFRDKFHIGFDQGMAMGDTAPGIYYPPGFFQPVDPDAAEPATINNPQSPLEQNTNRTMSAFRFNPAYNIDLLLFREMLGTISNAAYFKPWAAFYFLQHFSVRADVMYAMAARKQSTLGQKWSYGIELDGAVRYHDAREPIFFQLQYGVLFPLPAFNRTYEFEGVVRRDNARAVQTIQAQVGIRF
jgi:uncharacterized protein (TIGR04551 family)